MTGADGDSDQKGGQLPISCARWPSNLVRTDESDVMNCGYGHGFSVREVVAMLRKVTGRDFPVVEIGRRAGDPPALIADSTKLRRLTGWQPRHDDLEFIIRTAWNWEQVSGVRS